MTDVPTLKDAVERLRVVLVAKTTGLGADEVEYKQLRDQVLRQERPAPGLGAVLVAAMKEWKRSHEQNASSFLGIQQRMDKVLDVAINRESETLEKRLGFLGNGLVQLEIR